MVSIWYAIQLIKKWFAKVWKLHGHRYHATRCRRATNPSAQKAWPQLKQTRDQGQTTRPLTIFPVYFVFSKLLKCGILSLWFLFCRLQLIYQIRMWLITYLWVYPKESHTLTCRAETSTWTVLLDTLSFKVNHYFIVFFITVYSTVWVPLLV